MGATTELATWAAELAPSDVPERVVERTKAQFLSVLGAIWAGRHSEATGVATDVARSHGGPEEATVFATGERLPHLEAIFANACSSVSFDFDDYLFAGHTGHSAVCGSLAYGELTGASGRDVLTAAVAANEVGGRLGAALLFGPHNGQMWAYIHQLEGAVVAGRLLGLDAGRTADAVGVAMAQPVYPLIPAFMGPDSKLLIPSSTTVDGCRAAELAARGWTGSTTILEDHQGMLRRFNRDHLGWMLSGFGDAWVSDSLTFKVVPGCAYIDTAIDALEEIAGRFKADEGRPIAADDVEDVHVRCGMFTSGMEGFSQGYRERDRVRAVTVNFSVALSFGLRLAGGTLGPELLTQKSLDANREAIEGAAAKVRMEHDPDLDRRAARTAERGGFSLRALLSGASGGELAERLEEATADEGAEPRRTLEGASFEGYVMSFPTEVTLRTASGRTYEASQDVPLGAAGRPWEETLELVREKFLSNAPDRDRAAEALEVVERLDELQDVRELTTALARAAG